MINLFLGFQGDGKTTNLYSYCLKDDTVDRSQKIIISDDNLHYGAQEQQQKLSDMGGIKFISFDRLPLANKANEVSSLSKDYVIYFDACTSNVFSLYREFFYQFGDVEISYFLVIDFCRLFYIYEKNLNALDIYDSVIITKTDLIPETLENQVKIANILNELQEIVKCYISCGEEIPISLNFVNNYTIKKEKRDVAIKLARQGWTFEQIARSMKLDMAIIERVFGKFRS